MHLEVVTRMPEGDAHPTPLLFVHGMWQGAWCWDEFFLPYFAQHGYAAHALSLRGHSASEGHERLRRHSIADYGADVAEVASRLPRAPVLIGHSMGGVIVQRYLRACGAPAAVLLASVPPTGLLPTIIRFAIRHPLVFALSNLTLSMKPVVSTPELCREALFTPDTPQELVDSCFSRLQDESYRACASMVFPWRVRLPALALVSMLVFGAGGDRLITPGHFRPKSPQAPVLVLGGASDRLISRNDVESTARTCGTRAEFFDMGHNMMLDPGWWQVADRIRAWFDDHNL